MIDRHLSIIYQLNIDLPHINGLSKITLKYSAEISMSWNYRIENAMPHIGETGVFVSVCKI